MLFISVLDSVEVLVQEITVSKVEIGQGLQEVVEEAGILGVMEAMVVADIQVISGFIMCYFLLWLTVVFP
jgi:hypothetical protein